MAPKTGRDRCIGCQQGLRRAEIRRKFDEIVDFSGVEKFIDSGAGNPGNANSSKVTDLRSKSRPE